MELKKLRKMISYKEKVYNELKQAIINNELAPGEALNERRLADSLGISRTPIREALQWLERDGWVESEPCRGTWVREISGADIDELYQMRLALEPMAAELAASYISEAEREGLKTIVEELNKQPLNIKHQDFVNMDIEFHLYLAKISGNRLLYHSLNGLMEMMAMYSIQNMIRKTDPYQVPIGEHIDILMAIVNRDSLGAKAAAKKHITRAYAVAAKNLKG